MSEVKQLIDITREEWVTWHWERFQAIGSEDKMVRSYRRTPDEVAKAVADWEVYMKETAGYMSEMEGGKEPHEA